MKIGTLQRISKFCTVGYVFCVIVMLYIYDQKNNNNFRIDAKEQQIPTPKKHNDLPLHIAKIGQDADEL